MERSSNLADLTRVSKYHPVANYSYPRNGNAAPYSARSSLSRSDRSSLGSEGSAPGLIDDRTDSEVSVDDDYQYHAHMAELWDSFWQSGARGKTEEPLMHPRKQYPALIPSPGSRRRRQPILNDQCAGWPLPDGSPRERNRKPAAAYATSARPTATYSAFPKPTVLPPRTTSLIPARVSRSGPSSTPCRPPRPSDELLTPCIRQPAMVPAIIAPDNPSPLSPTRDRRPSSPFVQRASRSLDEGPTRPLAAKAEICAAASRSSTHLPLSGTQTPTARPPRHCKSMAHLAPPLPPPQSQPAPEPHSVFEYDDSESEAEHRRSFFRFHKRSDSDNRRSSKPAAPEPNVLRHRRNRALTAPSSPMRQQAERLCKQEPKRQGHDVFGRMLGRRSR